MKSALLEREEKNFYGALALVEEGISKYPTFPKLHMMGGQICSDDLEKVKSNLDRARKFYQRGLQECPNNAVIWILACRLEERAHMFDGNGSSDSKTGVGVTKARSLLELARLKNPKTPELWLEAIRMERRSGNDKLAGTLMARALQECPTSGLLLAENIATAPRVEQKSKSADAIKRCPEDPYVIAAVASLFASERKNEKARKWFDRAVMLDPRIGDSWAKYYAFELEVGTNEQREKLKERCVAAEPKYGELWTGVMKDMANRRKTVAEGLELVARHILEKRSQETLN
jgi:pre-mRNA-processing factor 6